MASTQEHSLRLRLDKRKGTMSEVEMAQFQKQQAECIAKAIKNEEVPAKEKHVRRTIIGTWQERGNSMFWSVLGKQPLPTQPLMCWKAMTVLHKILREGHPNVIKDSYVYRKTLRDLFSVYRFQGGIYGPLICEYLKIMQSKLEMHHKYPGVPGSLNSSVDHPIKIPERDINDVFTFAVESLDYQDLLLTLEENIFKTLDKSKNTSQIAIFQCRIAALVPILKECSGMYDVLVLVLTKLHKNLPPDSLDGHRDRFNIQHRRLRTFCLESSNLQYVTNLTSVPSIPENPPDFLVHKYQPRRKEPPKEEPKPVPITPQIDERDVLIEQLMREIDELRQQLAYTEQQAKEMEDGLRTQIMKLQGDLRRMEEFARQLKEENAFLKEQAETAPKEDLNAQAKARDADEKFNKLKLMYGKMRQDHIDLLRKNGENKQKFDDADRALKELEGKMEAKNEEILNKEKELQELMNKIGELEKVNQDLKINFDQSDEGRQNEIGLLFGKVDDLTKSLDQSEKQRKDAEDTINQLRQHQQDELSRLQGELGTLRQERERLLSSQSGTQDELSKLQSQSTSEMSKLGVEMQELQSSKQKLMSDNEKLQQELDQQRNQYTNETASLQQNIQNMMDEKKKAKLELLSSTAKECEHLIQQTLKLFSNVHHESGTTCSPEYLKTRVDGLSKKVQDTTIAYSTFHNDYEDVVPVLNAMNKTCQRISDVMISGKATSHMVAPEDATRMKTECQTVGQATLSYLKEFKENTGPQNVKTTGDKLEQEIAKILKTTEGLISKEATTESNDNIVDEEMAATEKLVTDAASRIEEIMNRSRKHHSGVQLEVNERILESCTALMKAIRELILKSKDLQDEIVSDGRGSASVKDFYKRHHKWTEGLLSAAKSVGYGATILVDAADKVIERKGKFEELVVSSHEIAASTAQLVAASRVKAHKNSKRLPPLMTASKGVGVATAGVVAAVRSGASMTEESQTVPDYSKMSLTQAKRWEMDSQVKILELEDKLQKERQNLGRLRQAHYQIAVEMYGEEAVNLD